MTRRRRPRTTRGVDDPGADDPGADLGRRRFFREFAGELIQGAASVVGAAQVLQRVSAEAASAILDPDAPGADRDRHGSGSAVRLPERLPDGRQHPVADRPAAAPRGARRASVRLRRGRRACDPPDDRSRCAGHRPGGGDRAGADRPPRAQHEAVRPPRDAPWRLERAHQRPPDGGQPALGGGSGHGALRGDRRAVGGRRGRSPRPCERKPTPSSSRPPRTTAGSPSSGWRRCRSRWTARCGS